MTKKAKHIVFWSLYVILNSLIQYTQQPSSYSSYDQVGKYSTSILFFYIIVFIFKKYELVKKRIAFVLLSLIFFYLIRFIYYYYDVLNYIYNGELKFSFNQFFLKGLWWWSHYLAYAYFYFYYTNTIKLKDEKLLLQKNNAELEKHNLELTIQNQQLENQKLEAEYNYLRTQINPHFLYNTLNYFYGKVAPHDAKAAEGVLLLTNIMRYSLHKGDEQGRVPLQLEIENLENYLKLQKLRFGSQLNLQYQKQDIHVAEYKILPHLLITLAENAIKHGNNMDAKHPLVITLGFENDTIHFSVKNKINDAKHKQPTTQSGLKNLESRLLSVYKNKHTYVAKTTNEFYEAVLTIQLNTEIDKVNVTEKDNDDEPTGKDVVHFEALV